MHFLFISIYISLHGLYNSLYSNRKCSPYPAAKSLQSCPTLCDPIDSSPPEKQLNELEIGNLPEKEFRIMIMKMIQDLRKIMEKMQGMFTKDLELKNKQRKLSNTLEEINTRITQAELISGLDDRW